MSTPPDPAGKSDPARRTVRKHIALVSRTYRSRLLQLEKANEQHERWFNRNMQLWAILLSALTVICAIGFPLFVNLWSLRGIDQRVQQVDQTAAKIVVAQAAQQETIKAATDNQQSLEARWRDIEVDIRAAQDRLNDTLRRSIEADNQLTHLKDQIAAVESSLHELVARETAATMEESKRASKVAADALEQVKQTEIRRLDLDASLKEVAQESTRLKEVIGVGLPYAMALSMAMPAIDLSFPDESPARRMITFRMLGSGALLLDLALADLEGVTTASKQEIQSIRDGRLSLVADCLNGMERVAEQMSRRELEAVRRPVDWISLDVHSVEELVARFENNSSLAIADPAKQVRATFARRLGQPQGAQTPAAGQVPP